MKLSDLIQKNRLPHQIIENALGYYLSPEEKEEKEEKPEIQAKKEKLEKVICEFLKITSGIQKDANLTQINAKVDRLISKAGFGGEELICYIENPLLLINNNHDTILLSPRDTYLLRIYAANHIIRELVRIRGVGAEIGPLAGKLNKLDKLLLDQEKEAQRELRHPHSHWEIYMMYALCALLLAIAAITAMEGYNLPEEEEGVVSGTGIYNYYPNLQRRRMYGISAAFSVFAIPVFLVGQPRSLPAAPLSDDMMNAIRENYQHLLNGSLSEALEKPRRCAMKCFMFFASPENPDADKAKNNIIKLIEEYEEEKPAPAPRM
jgi:hypothetical protein